MFLLDGVNLFFFIVKNMILKKDFNSLLIFILFLRENKMKKKTLNITLSIF